MDSRVRVLILVFLVALNLFIGLGNVPLLDPDEPVYAETAKEMIKFGDFLSPNFIMNSGMISHRCIIGW